jgi:hypothetical protein
MENPETVEKENALESVDIEEYAKTNAPPPRAKKYIFRVDKQRLEVDDPIITGSEVLAKVGKSSQTHKLYQHKRGHQPIPIGPTEQINLREPGVERFTTMPKDTTEGLERRQEFRLPEADNAYLNSLGLHWEAVMDGQSQWIIIYDWKIPSGYNHAQAKLALLIPGNYSDTQIDMVFFSEHLARVDKREIKNLSNLSICGASWQQWSRHRTSANPWRPGVDDVASHLALVDEWLRREL